MDELNQIPSSLGGQEQFIADLADIQEYLSYMTQLIFDSQAEADSEDYFMRQFADEYLQALKLKERQLAGIRIYLQRLERQKRTDSEPMYMLLRDLMNDVEPKCRQVIQALTRIRDGRSGISASGNRLYVTTTPPVVEVQGSLFLKTPEITSPSDSVDTADATSVKAVKSKPIVPADKVVASNVSPPSETTSIKVVDSKPPVSAGKVVSDSAVNVDNAVNAVVVGVTGLSVSPVASQPDSNQSNPDLSNNDDKTPAQGSVAAGSSPAQAAQRQNIAQQQQQQQQQRQQQEAQNALKKQQEQLLQQQQQQQLKQFANGAQKPNGSQQTVQASSPRSGSNAAVSPVSRAGPSQKQQQPTVTPPTPLPRQQQQQTRPTQPSPQHQQPSPVQISQQQQPHPAASLSQQSPQKQTSPTQSPRQPTTTTTQSSKPQTSHTHSPRQPSSPQQSPPGSIRSRQLEASPNTTPVDSAKLCRSITEDWVESVKQRKEDGVTKLRIDRKRPEFLQTVCEFYESHRDRELRRDFQVIFEGEEDAVDRGALSREFFYISFENTVSGLFKGCKLMIGERGHLLPDATLDHLVHAFKVLGIMTAHAVKSGCHGLPGLSPAIKYYLIHGNGLAFIEDLQPPVTIDDVADEQLHNILFKLNNIETLDDAENAALLEWMDRSNCRMKLDFGTRMLIVQTLLIYYVFKMRIRQIDAFVEGLDVFELRRFLRENPSDENTSIVFPSHEELNITPEVFLATVINRGDEFDIQIWEFFQEFLRELHSGNIDNMGMPDLIRFLSGSPYLPSRVVVSFSRKAVLPIAHACFNEIELPMLHDNYSSFREALIKGLGCTEFAMG